MHYPGEEKVLIGPIRMTTQSREKKNKNNHPFPGKAGTAYFALAHNGVLHNDSALRRIHRLPGSRVQTDSYVAVQLLEKAGEISHASLAAMAEELEGSLHMPPQKCNLTADDGASPPPEWCTPSAKMVHGGRERGAPDRHAGNYSWMPLRFRMDSPSIWMV